MQTKEALSFNDIKNLYDNGTAIIQEWSNLHKQYQSKEMYLSDLIYIDYHESLSDFAKSKIDKINIFGGCANPYINWDQFINNINGFYEYLNTDSNNRIIDENHYLYNLIEVERIDSWENDIHLSSITEHYSMEEFITLLNESINEPITTSKGIESFTKIESIYI
ncbi:hypothetical protein [Oceanobacillus oncorhynchi]|uniref:hypothetical protein n=1 Tax=Oceanobacillus oncorhynchi TaxID=545501 RepID=UPI0034D4942E